IAMAYRDATSTPNVAQQKSRHALVIANRSSVAHERAPAHRAGSPVPRSVPVLRPSFTDERPRVAAVSKPPKLRLIPEAPAPAVSTGSSVGNNPSPVPMSGAEIARVEQRLHDSLTSDMFENFELFLYVSKASVGPWAQHMYVFEKQPSGDLRLIYNWLVSTGR